MWRYYLREGWGLPNNREIGQYSKLYRDDRKNPIERYVGQGAWVADDNSGKIACDIAGFGGNWYDYDPITPEELERLMRMLDERLGG